jgi:MFS family permease
MAPDIFDVTVAALSGPEERPKRQGLISAVWGLAAILGPLAGTLAEMTVGWRWIFLVNVPACGVLLAVLWAGPPLVGREKAPPALPRQDLLLLSGVAALLLLALSPASLDLPRVVPVACACAAALPGALVARRWMGAFREGGGSLFQARWLPALGASACAAFVLYGSVTYLPQLMVHGLRQPMAAGGAGVLAGSLGWVLGSLACGRALVHLGYSRAAFLGASMMVLASLALGGAAMLGRWKALVAAEFLLGVGMGGVANASLLLVQNLAAPGELGTMTGLIHLGRSLGAALGVNALATALAWMDTRPTPPSVLAGYGMALFLLAPMAAMAALAALRMPGRYGEGRALRPNPSPSGPEPLSLTDLPSSKDRP